MLRFGFTSLMLALAAPSLAQPSGADPAPPAAAVPDREPSRPDQARLTAAGELVDLFMPPGSMREFMTGFMPDDDTILAMAAQQLGIEIAGMTREQQARAVEEQGASRDRHFSERFRIMSEVMRRVSAEAMAEMEPEMRAVMVTLLARQFTATELAEISAFFRTPVGSRYARTSMTMMRDPAWQEFYTLMTPRMLEMQQRMESELNAATAHLDPAPQS